MLLVNPAYKGVTEDWFRPEHWGAQATPVASGGRGSAWFVDSDQGGLVLRQYRRGGLMSRVSESRYLFTGAGRVRSVREYRLLEDLYEQDLPVPKPVAACYWRSGLFYQAAIIIERISESVTFGDVWKDLPADTWAEIGSTIRRFHDAGVFHSDLNCFNVLLQGRKVYLIDFDKGKDLASSAKSESWKLSNLSRLHRSLQRQVSKRADENYLAELWPKLEQAYRGR